MLKVRKVWKALESLAAAAARASQDGVTSTAAHQKAEASTAPKEAGGEDLDEEAERAMRFHAMMANDLGSEEERASSARRSSSDGLAMLEGMMLSGSYDENDEQDEEAEEVEEVEEVEEEEPEVIDEPKPNDLSGLLDEYGMAKLYDAIRSAAGGCKYSNVAQVTRGLLIRFHLDPPLDAFLSSPLSFFLPLLFIFLLLHPLLILHLSLSISLFRLSLPGF